nr:hypothetical protein [Kocuria palustris]
MLQLRLGLPAAALLLLLPPARRPARPEALALLQIGREAAAEQGAHAPAAAALGIQAGVEVEDRLRRGVEQPAVVAGQQDGSAPGLQLADQEVRGVVVEVVGGLVQQQGIRGVQQGRSELQTSALPAGELLQRALPRQGPQSEAVEHGADPRVQAPQAATFCLRKGVVPLSGQHLLPLVLGLGCHPG